MTLRLPPSLRAQIEAEARRAFPNECCGLIEGVWQDGEAQALVLHPAPDGTPDKFAIDPAAHFTALKAARANGHALIGCYHSHPNGQARPSDKDRDGAGAENFIWLIAALTDANATPALCAWRYRGSNFEETGWATGADWVTSSS